MGRSRILRALTKKSFIATAGLLLVFWNECLHLFLISLTWSVLVDESPTGEPRATRILLVADPQMIGYHNEPPFVGPIARWDSDRYLRNGFHAALIQSQPDALFFMGDLFDEGIESSEAEFEETVRRFKSIFTLPKNAERVFIAGDNDVGGEAEIVLKPLVDRFRRTFVNVLDMRSLGLHNLALQELNIFNNELFNISKPEASDRLLMLLSHSPVIRSYGAPSKTAWERGADLILSAHDHTAEVYTRSRSGSAHSTFDRASIDDAYVLSARVGKRQPALEIMSPTCSYRMGVPRMGYGLLTLRPVQGSTTGELELETKYTVLWLPGRYPQLFSYVALLLWLGAAAMHTILYSLLKRFIMLRGTRTFKRNIV